MNLWQKLKSQWPVILFTVVVFIVALRPLEDFDTFWQLQSGKYILESGHFLYRDTFSITPDAFRFEHCWLSDIIFYLHYLAGGYKLLSLLKTIVITMCGLLLYRFNVRRGADPLIVIPVLTLCLAASIDSWYERPQLWTFLLSILCIHILHKGREPGSKIWCWLVPIMLVWANLHAGSIFGFILIGFFFIGEIVRLALNKTSLKSLFFLFVIGIATFSVAFINPYGRRIPMQVFAHLNLTNINSGQQSIMEWLPPASEQIVLFNVVFILWGCILLAKWRKNDPVEILFYCAFLYMGTSQIRHSVFVPILAGYYLPVSLHDVVRRFVPEYKIRTLPRALFRLCAMTALAVFLSQNVDRATWGWGLNAQSYPVAATQFLINNKLPSTMYNFYDWGGYLMWMLYPRYPVFIDGRNTSEEILLASNRIDNSREGWLDDFTRYNVNTVITRTCYYDSGGPIPLVETLAKSPDWVLIYRDSVAVIFIKKDEKFRYIWGKKMLPSFYVYETMYAEAQRLLRENPKRTMVQLSLARSSLAMQRYTEALAYYSRHLENNPADSESRLLVDFLAKKSHL